MTRVGEKKSKATAVTTTTSSSNNTTNTHHPQSKLGTISLPTDAAELGFDLPFDRCMTDSSDDDEDEEAEHDEYLYHYGTQQQQWMQHQQQTSPDAAYYFSNENNNGGMQSGSDIPSDEEEDDEEEEHQQQLPSALRRVCIYNSCYISSHLFLTLLSFPFLPLSFFVETSSPISSTSWSSCGSFGSSRSSQSRS